MSKDIDQRIKYRNALADDIQAQIDKIAKKINDLLDHDLETYQLLNSPDSLYGDSPIGRAFTWNWIKQYMIKKDLDFVGYVLDGKVSIRPFSERMRDASNWIARFKDPVESKKTGIKEIVGG